MAQLKPLEVWSLMSAVWAEVEGNVETVLEIDVNMDEMDATIELALREIDRLQELGKLLREAVRDDIRSTLEGWKKEDGKEGMLNTDFLAWMNDPSRRVGDE